MGTDSGSRNGEFTLILRTSVLALFTALYDSFLEEGDLGEGQIGWRNSRYAVGAQSILSNCAVPGILGLWSDQAPAA